MLSETHYRNGIRDAAWFSKLEGLDATVVGAGGIGSWLSIFLSRLGLRLTIWDDDDIEDTNRLGQAYSAIYIGKSKAQAIAAILADMSGTPLATSFKKRVTHDTGFVTPVTFSAVDNMLGRKDIFNKWKMLDNKQILIDGRLGPDHFQVYAVLPGQEEKYERTLFDDVSLPNLPCTFKQTTHVAAAIASMMTTVFVNYLANMEVPVKAEFHAPSCLLMTTYD